MAVDPEYPNNREEMYLADIAGKATEVPPCPWNRKEAYLADIAGRIDGMDGDIDELNRKIAALATDFSYKGSKPTYEDLPTNPEVGDVWTVSDTGKMYVWDGSTWQVLNMTGQDIEQSDWAENDSTDPAYVKNRTHYEEMVENTVPQYGSTSAGATPDSGYVWFIEKVEDYALSDELNVSDGDTVYMDVTFSVNGVERTDGAKFEASVENGTVSLDSLAEAGNRWRGAYASELDGDTTFRFPVASSDSSATVYITGITYRIVKELDAKYIPVDGDTITVDANGKLASTGGGGPTVVQTTGTSTTDVMSQNAVTGMVYPQYATRGKYNIAFGMQADTSAVTTNDGAIAIGRYAKVVGAKGINITTGTSANSGAGPDSVVIGGGTMNSSAANTIAIGAGTHYMPQPHAIKIGAYSTATRQGAIALGANSSATQAGEMNIGSTDTSCGYNNSNYRLLTGLYDPQSAHDAVNKQYVDGLVGDVASALNVINNGSN